MNLTENAKEILEFRYLITSKGDKESPEDMLHRVANSIASAEISEEAKNKWEKRFYRMMNELKFLPNTPCLINAGKKPTRQLLACFVIGIDDSIKGIFDSLKTAVLIHKEGGGTGFSFSSLRPKGSEVKHTNGVASGPVSFLKIFDVATGQMKQGGVRRGANMATLRCDHPDIFEFVRSKNKEGRLSNFNLSVAITDKFMNKLELGEPFSLTWKGNEVETINPNALWDEIVSGTWNSGEPSVIFIDQINKRSELKEIETIESCNPCIVGNSMVYVADGRQYVDIKTLAEENKDIPVFCFNKKIQKVEVQMMRRPRLTGKNKKILKVTLDDGSIVRCTENHKFYTKGGSIKRADELVSGDRLHHMISYNASFKEILNHSNSKSQDYKWINTGFSQTISEHRILAEFKLGRKLKFDEVVHHDNYNGLDNTFDNLIVMTKEDHDKLHSLNMFGDNNPMNRFPEKNWLIKQDHSGCNNGRYKGVTPDHVFNQAIKYSKELGRRVTKDEWHDYCLSSGLPSSSYSLGDYTCSSKMLLAAAKKAGVIALEHSSHIREYKRFLELIKETDMDIFFDSGCIYVNKICEWCGDPFITKWRNRERSFCSWKCSNDYGRSDEGNRNKFYSYLENRQRETRINQMYIYNILRKNLKRNPLRKEWESSCKKSSVHYRIRCSNESGFNKYCFTSYKDLQQASELNFVVVSVEEDGYEDVYNGTVDGNHNFYIMVNEDETKSKKPKHNNILCAQCGEQPLPSNGSCVLGSINLSKFVKNKEFDFQSLEKIVGYSVRFLDDVIDVTTYPTSQFEIEAKKTRRIGLGIMGLADTLIKLEIDYRSKEAIEISEKIMKALSDYANEASEKLGKEKGIPEKLVSIGMTRRNGLLTTIAPTGSISLIANCSSGCEPVFSFEFEKKCIEETITIKHPLYEKWVNEHPGKKVPEYFACAKDIKPEQHIKMLSTLQKYIHSGISKTINLPKNITKKEISDTFHKAYQSGCKSVTMYREGSREVEAQVSKRSPVERPSRTEAIIEKIRTNKGHLYIAIGEVKDENDIKKPFDVFLITGKSGADESADGEAIARLISLALRSGIDVVEIIKQLKNIRGNGVVWNYGFPVYSVPDAVAKILEKNYSDVEFQKEGVGTICAECKNYSVVLEEGCSKCLSCGWSNCG